MTVYVLLFAVLLWILIYPYLRIAVKRLTFVHRLRKLCERKGWHLYGTRPLWMFASRRDVRCDCYLETAHDLYAVKLFALKRRHSTLIFQENGTYVVRSYLGFVGNTGVSVRMPLDSREKPFPQYQFRYGFQDRWEILTPHAVLLLHPTCHEVLRIPQYGKEEILGAGMMINNCELYTSSRFLGKLEGSD